ncbi:MAG: pilus assembly protein CpaA [Caulobacteraceae bacterium]|nr:pilus assembly protein CpaA [Caulobacteraceae bacterium]
MSTIFQIVLVVAFPALAIAAALKDLTSYTIPNGISLALAGAFFALAAALGLPLSEVGGHVLVGAIALIGGMALFALGWIGGGDAKLTASCCLWLGWPATQGFLLDTVVVGGVFAVILLTLRAPLVRAHMPVAGGWFGRLTAPGEPAPYGVAIAIGALLAFPAADLIRFVHTSY